MPDNSAIVQDWYLHEGLPRTNAVTFRDKRKPYDILVREVPAGFERHFNPPITRQLSEEPYTLRRPSTERSQITFASVAANDRLEAIVLKNSASKICEQYHVATELACASMIQCTRSV